MKITEVQHMQTCKMKRSSDKLLQVLAGHHFYLILYSRVVSSANLSICKMTLLWKKWQIWIHFARKSK